MKRVLILLSGIMIGSTLFAVPKKRKIVNEGDISMNEMNISLAEVLFAVGTFASGQPEEESQVEYYNRMTVKSFSGMSVRERYDRLTAKAGTVDFPLARNVSEVFLSLLVRCLPDSNATLRTWRETIVDCISKFRSGEMDVATIESKMCDFLDEADKDGVVFAHSKRMLAFFLVLYELERLMGIAQ